MSRRPDTAWWVRPETGEVVPVRAHVLTLLETPARFGLKVHDLRAAGIPSNRKPVINHLSPDPASPRMRLIARAVALGWVRVRVVRGCHILAQVLDGDHARATAAVDLCCTAPPLRIFTIGNDPLIIPKTHWASTSHPTSGSTHE